MLKDTTERKQNTFQWLFRGQVLLENNPALRNIKLHRIGRSPEVSLLLKETLPESFMPLADEFGLIVLGSSPGALYI